jgi:hypothetical protein
LVLPNYLQLFCQDIVKKYTDPQKVSEEQKATEFRKFYLRDLPLNVHSLRTLASACDINTTGLQSDKMPAKLRGYHDIMDGRQNIYYREEDSLSGIQNTILHELREMMEPLFAEACPGYRPMQTRAKHIAANNFATAVLLPRKEFLTMALESGLDVIELARFYHKSCAQVMLRLGEVVQQQLFFYAALFGELPDKPGQWQVNYWTQSLNIRNPELNVLGAASLFLRKGNLAETGSIVDMVIQHNRPCLIEQVVTRKNGQHFELLNLAQPSILDQNVNKVCLIILPTRNKNLI